MVLPDTRNQVPVNGGAVTGEGLEPRGARFDIFHPVCEPVRNERGTTGLAQLTGADFGAQLIELVDDAFFGLGLSVPPVRLAVVFHADDDPAVPVTVRLAVVEGARSVGCAGAFRTLLAGHGGSPVQWSSGWVVGCCSAVSRAE